MRAVIEYFDLDAWALFGLLGQLCFTMRFAWQWFTSEKEKRSVIPEAFWYFSLAGGAILLVYAIRRRDIVITLGQCFGVVVYVRNLVLIHREKVRLAAVELPATPPPATGPHPAMKSAVDFREETAGAGTRLD
ncbi:MAG TPA: hypothetical protein ENK43_07570 [Planctomycetes bacterium]|nr:hypothetical protein [Planctomycetota bacterium]